jgi:hypothetical protein
MATTPPLKQEIEQKDFKGDIFGKKFSLVKDEKTGEVMFDFVELPKGFDVKSIKCFRVIGKSIAEVEAELRKLLKKDAPTAGNTGNTSGKPFGKKTADELAEMSDDEIAIHISLGLSNKTYTDAEAEELTKAAKAKKNAKAAADKFKGFTEDPAFLKDKTDEEIDAFLASKALSPERIAEIKAAVAAARTAPASDVETLVTEFKGLGELVGKVEADVDTFLAGKAELSEEKKAEVKAAILAAIQEAKAAEIEAFINEFKGDGELVGKAEADVDAFLAGKAELSEEKKAEVKAAILAAIEEAAAPAGGGKRTRKHKHKPSKKFKTRKHKK